MAVYVDTLVDYGWRLGPSCHMVADDLEELHAFARKVGLRRSWLHISRGGIPHYDLTVRRRAVAIKLGAVDGDAEPDRVEAKFKELRARARSENAI